MLEARLEKSYPVRLIVVGAFTCGLGALAMYLISRHYVRILDPEGVTLRNGKRYQWSDLRKVRPVYVYRPGRSYLNHVDLLFSGGKAGVYYQVFENGAEVLQFVRNRTGQPIPFTAT